MMPPPLATGAMFPPPTAIPAPFPAPFPPIFYWPHTDLYSPPVSPTNYYNHAGSIPAIPQQATLVNKILENIFFLVLFFDLFYF